MEKIFKTFSFEVTAWRKKDQNLGSPVGIFSSDLAKSTTATVKESEIKMLSAVVYPRDLWLTGFERVSIPTYYSSFNLLVGSLLSAAEVALQCPDISLSIYWHHYSEAFPRFESRLWQRCTRIGQLFQLEMYSWLDGGITFILLWLTEDIT